MVILRGIVRSGRDSTEDVDFPIANAAIIQESSAVYTSTNGTFYTSALTLDVATCQATEYETAQYSIPDFATIYDPAGVISGSITHDANVSISGVTIMTDTNKIFLTDSLVSRTLSMRSGVYDGFSGIITQNTQNTFRMGGSYVTSGGGGVITTHSSFVLLPAALPVAVAGGDGWKIKYSPNNEYLALAYDSQSTILKRSGDTYTELGDPLSGTIYAAAGLAWSPDSKYLMITIYGSPYVVFFKRTGDTFTQISDPDVMPVASEDAFAAAFSPDGTHVIHGQNASNGVMLYKMDPASGDLITYVTDCGGLSGHRPSSVKYSPDGVHLSLADWANEFVWVYKRSGDTYTLVQTLTNPTGGAFVDTDYTPDSKYMIGSTYQDGDQNVFVWEISGDVFTEVINPITDQPEGVVTEVAITTDGYLVAFGTEGGDTRGIPVFTVSGGILTRLSGNYFTINADFPGTFIDDVAFSPDGTHMIAVNTAWTGHYYGANVWTVGETVRGGGATSAFIVIAASSGDIYNIGGMSGEPTTNIVFTLWDNKAYGRGKTR